MNGNAKGKKQVGFWRQTKDEKSDLPWPGDLVEPRWNPALREVVASYLDDEKFRSTQYRGVSECRLCGRSTGSADFTDGTYVWPEGYAHYIRIHAVVPPRDLVEHIKNRPVGPVGLPPIKVSAMQLDAGQKNAAYHTLNAANLYGPWTNFDEAAKYGQAKVLMSKLIDRACFDGGDLPAAWITSFVRMTQRQWHHLDGKPDTMGCRRELAKTLLTISANSLKEEHRRRQETWDRMKVFRGHESKPEPVLGKVVGRVEVDDDWPEEKYREVRDFILKNFRTMRRERS